jgi:DNA-binding response OmpR family regulator
VDDLRILVIEDDETVRALLRRAFSKSGAQVLEAGDGQSGMRAIFTGRPHAVLLDIELPGIDGFTALERIRELTDVPVMMLTSSDRKDAKLRAFAGGADDYVTKPFDSEELVARTHALVRRRGAAGGDAREDLYADEEIEVDFARVEARAGGRKLDLTPLQFRLLGAFVRHPDEALTPEQLLERSVSRGTHSPERVKVHIANLRRKIAEAGASPGRIETVRGFGYRYRRAR